MDGVLTDFEKRYDELFGVRPEEVAARSKHFWSNFDAFIEGGNFKTLEKHPYADQLLQFVHELRVPVEILTSSGGEKHYDQVSVDKIEWLLNNGINYKANVVSSGSKKAEYARPWHILIDDTPQVVEKYRAVGGIAILHKDIQTTLSELAKIHLEWSDNM